jgi:2-keto-4-pentenoate hydratase
LQRLRNNQPYRNLSADCAGATIADAYELQRAFVHALVEAGDWGSVVGYKAALTAPQAQQMMGATEPVVGVLFSGGERLAQRTISVDRPVMLETELGFRLNRPIDTAPTESITPTYIEHVSPMIELAAPNLEQRPNAVDLIASNSATYGFIAGSAYNTDWQDATTRPDLDRLSINLFQGDDILHAETAGSIMQGQWHAVTWLVNALLELGYPLAKEHLLMTGSIGALHPGKPGEYRAEYGQLGNIEFNL